jgi:hypothetical protein
MDLNPSIIKLLIKFAKSHLNGHSLKEEEEALNYGLSIISKCVNNEDKKSFESLIPFVDQRFEEINCVTLPFDRLSINNRHLGQTVWNISDAFELALNQLKLNINQKVLNKLFKLNYLAENHSKIIVCGKSQYGKSLLIKSFVKAKSYIDPKQSYHHIMLQLWSLEDLFSKYDTEEGLFHQGHLPNLINNNKENVYLHLDGFNRPDLSTIEDFVLNLNHGHVFWEVSLIFR